MRVPFWSRTVGKIFPVCPTLTVSELGSSVMVVGPGPFLGSVLPPALQPARTTRMDAAIGAKERRASMRERPERQWRVIGSFRGLNFLWRTDRGRCRTELRHAPSTNNKRAHPHKPLLE